MNLKPLLEAETQPSGHVPVSERVLDKLGDILFAADEILDMLRRDDRLHDPSSQELRDSVLSVYEQVNDLMKGLAD